MNRYDKADRDQHRPIAGTTPARDRDAAGDPAGSPREEGNEQERERDDVTRPRLDDDAIEHLQQAPQPDSEPDSNEIADRRARIVEE